MIGGRCLRMLFVQPIALRDAGISDRAQLTCIDVLLCMLFGSAAVRYAVV